MIKKFFSGKNVLITGGAGFVGANLTRALLSENAKITIVDNFHPSYGANEFNFTGVREKIELIRGDITDRELMKKLCADTDVVFHIAAQCSHVDSMIDPWTDVQYNCVGTLSMLEAVKESKKKPSVVYAGTRAIIGAPREVPAREDVLPNPVDVYGVNKHAAELYGSVYARVHKIPFVSIRLTNSFGPYHQMKNGKYGILNWFMSLALQNKPIKIYGTGEQLRDYIYIDDAVRYFMSAAQFAEKMRNQECFEEVQLSGKNIPYAVFNVVSGKQIRFVDCAKKITEITKTPLEFIPWPADRAAIETGDFIADSRLSEKLLGVVPEVSFEKGLEKTIAYYREHLPKYL